MMKKIPFVALALSTLLAGSSTVRAETYGELVHNAGARCRSDAAELRAQAASCRAKATPPPEGGEYCTGIQRTEITSDGTHTYVLDPDVADSLADRFDGYAPQLEQAARDIAELEAKVAKTTAKIKKLGWHANDEDYAAWQQLGEDAREQLAKETRAFAIARLLDGPELAEQGIAKLTRGEAEQLAGTLGRYGELGEQVGVLLKRTARITARAERAEVAAQLIKLLHALYDQAVAENDADAAVALLSYLGELAGLDGLGFVVDEAKWSAAAVYAYAANAVAETEIDRLGAMNVDQLRALKSLTELLHRQVDQIRSAVGELHACSYAIP